MIEMIPATDLIGGRCVRLTQGDYTSRKTYYRDPLEAALRFEEAGARRLHMVDLDGAKAAEPQNLAVLERIAAKTSLEVQYGGGIKSRAGCAASSTPGRAGPSAAASRYANRSCSPGGSRSSAPNA